jgi:hypothetical protein
MEDFLPGSSASSMSTSSAFAPADRILCVKSSVTGIGWNEIHRRQLEDFAETVNLRTSHAYSLLKYIFLHGFEENEDFSIEDFLNKNFFAEVWLSLTVYAGNIELFIVKYAFSLTIYPTGSVGPVTAERRQFINLYRDRYLQIAGYARRQLAYVQQTSIIEGTKMYTAYANNIHMHFGNHLLNVRERNADFTRWMEEEGLLTEKRYYKTSMTLPERRFREAISARIIHFDEFTRQYAYSSFTSSLASLDIIWSRIPISAW